MRILALALALVAVAPAAALARPVNRDPKHGLSRSTSSNWSGYDVTGSGGSHVIGTWTQPLALCSAGENSWSSPWVGIDGDTSGSVEQIGTDSDCNSGTPFYYAWYEMYPKSLVQLSMPVVAGHSYTGEVTAQPGGQYLMTLTDNTAHTSFTTTQVSKRATNASVEWIMEGPSSGLLTDFNSVAFTGTNGAINGQAGPLNALTGAQPITMVSNSRKGSVVRAQPSSLDGKGGFSIAWLHG